MQEIRLKAVDHLKADGNLWPGLVSGGIYDRKLSKEREHGTPAAFAPYPGDLLKIERVRNSIVIFGPNDVDPPDGPTNTEDVHLRNGFLRVYYYVPATSDGKLDLDRIDGFVRARLNGWQTLLSTGYPLTIRALDMVEAMDSDEWEHTLVSSRRFLCEWLRGPNL